MKKTLIALAVLAASGASFAQVTVSGNLTMGYQAASDAAKNDTSGFGVDTSEIDFAATEDLGGGTKIVANLALAGADRSGESTAGGVVTGRNASLAVTTSVGTLTLAAERAGDYLSSGIAGVGAYYSGFDGKIFNSRVNRDAVYYTVPVGAFTLGATYQESDNLVGLGNGTTGTAALTGQTIAGVLASYAKGPLTGNLTYLSFNARQNSTYKDQTRLSGAYNFGVVSLGLGAVVTNSGLTAGGKATDLLLGVSAPFGALTVGGQLAQRKIDDVAFTAQGVGTINGSALQVSYALSKRTSFIGNYARWDSVTGAANASTQTQLFLSHSF